MSSVSEIDGPGDPSAVDRARSRWQHELAALGGRNTLLWFDVQADTVLDLTHAHPGGVAMLLAGRDTRLSDLVREPDALDAAGRRARHVRDAADDALDATGIRSCFLVLGLASWTIPGSERHPVAPVLLRRCTLRPVVAGGRDHVLDLSDVVEINPVLVGYLRSQAGLSIDPDDIVDRAHDRSGFNPALVWERLRRECAGLPDLVVEPSLAVAVVPYGKADRVADVTDPAVPLERSDLLAAAAGDETARERLLARRDGLADEADKAGITDDAEPSVLELDPQQHAAATLVDDGADLAVRAPVGTGASSLVADVVARAAGAGRTVLLVSESGAAIRAVGRRLAGVGLDDALLHLDDPAGAFDARTFIERWSDVEVPDRKALAAIESDAQARADRVTALAEVLADHVRALHDPREPWGCSMHEAQEEIVGLSQLEHPPRARFRLSDDVLLRTTPTSVDEIGPRVRAVVEDAAGAGEDLDPWHRADLVDADEARAAVAAVSRLRSSLDELRAVFDEVFSGLRLPEQDTVAQRGILLSTLEQVRDSLEVFRPEVFDQPLTDMVAATGPREAGPALSRRDRWRLTNQAKGFLRPGPPPQDLHEALRRAQQQRTVWFSVAGAGGRPRVPEDIDRAHEVYEEVHDDLVHLSRVLAGTRAGGDLLEMPEVELRRLLADLAEHPERAVVAATVRSRLRALDEDGWGGLVDELLRRGTPAAHVPTEVRFVWWASLADHVSRTDPAYGGHDGARLRRAAVEYDGLIDEVRLDVAGGIARRVRSTMRERARELRREARWVGGLATGRTAPVATSDVTAGAPRLLSTLAPCWACSPLAVPSLVPPDQRFDLVVVDDAARTTTARIASALARADRVLLVGDPDQLGPAGVERTTPSAWDELAPLLPQVTLERLEGQAPESLDLVRARREGAGDRALWGVPGRSTSPRLWVDPAEASIEAVLSALRRHVAATPSLSLAVLTIDDASARAIESAVAEAAGGDDALRRWLDEVDEPLLVRAADRMHRRQRDLAVIALAPLADAAWPSLVERDAWAVVATSRGRYGCVVLPPAGDAPEPVVELVEEVRRAAQGAPAPDDAATRSAAGAMADLLARRLRDADVTVRVDHGTGAHTIDLAVSVDDGPPVLAVDLDGPGYAAQRHPRFRDRWWTRSLESRGWRHLRIWSIDVYRDPAREEARVREVLAALQATKEQR